MLAHHDEESVAEFDHLGEHEQEAPDGDLRGVEGFAEAEAVVKAFVVGGADKAGDDAAGAKNAEGC